MARACPYDPANPACLEVPGALRGACIDKAAATGHNRALIKVNPIYDHSRHTQHGRILRF
jgi:hypothetical protein